LCGGPPQARRTTDIRKARPESYKTPNNNQQKPTLSNKKNALSIAG
jgi:hypothetical protein